MSAIAAGRRLAQQLARTRLPQRTRLSQTRPYFYSSRTFTSTSVTMSQQQQQQYKYEYLVTIPDQENSLSKRLAIRPQHLANLKPRIESGQVVFGGASMSKQPTEGESPDMTGSVMLIKADSEEDVKKFVEADAYTEGGVWDLSRMKIVPFRCAVRTAM